MTAPVLGPNSPVAVDWNSPRGAQSSNWAYTYIATLNSSVALSLVVSLDNYYYLQVVTVDVDGTITGQSDWLDTGVINNGYINENSICRIDDSRALFIYADPVDGKNGLCRLVTVDAANLSVSVGPPVVYMDCQAPTDGLIWKVSGLHWDYGFRVIGVGDGKAAIFGTVSKTDGLTGSPPSHFVYYAIFSVGVTVDAAGNITVLPPAWLDGDHVVGALQGPTSGTAPDGSLVTNSSGWYDLGSFPGGSFSYGVVTSDTGVAFYYFHTGLDPEGDGGYVSNYIATFAFNAGGTSYTNTGRHRVRRGKLWFYAQSAVGTTAAFMGVTEQHDDDYAPKGIAFVNGHFVAVARWWTIAPPSDPSLYNILSWPGAETTMWGGDTIVGGYKSGVVAVAMATDGTITDTKLVPHSPGDTEGGEFDLTQLNDGTALLGMKPYGTSDFSQAFHMAVGVDDTGTLTFGDPLDVSSFVTGHNPFWWGEESALGSAAKIVLDPYDGYYTIGSFIIPPPPTIAIGRSDVHFVL